MTVLEGRDVHCRRSSATGFAAVLVLTVLTASTAGCRADSEPAARGAARTATPSPVAATAAVPAPPPATANTVSLSDPEEQASVTAALAAADLHGVTVGDQPIPAGARFVLRAWAVVTGPRADVLTITRAQVRAVLEGRIDNWAALGGAAVPLIVVMPDADAAEIARLFAPAGLGERVARRAAPAAVALDPGTLALVPIDALTPDVLALVVDGHDPLRDPARTAPLRAERWVQASTPEIADAVAARLGWSPALNLWDPVGVIATGDYLAVRCAWEAMSAAGGPDSALTGVRHLLAAADLAIVELESGLTSSTTPTPCVRTFTLVGPAAAARSLARAGVDVATRAANHAFDCWDACAPEQIRAETDEALAAAGVVSVGTGEDLAAARAPAIVTAGGVRFAVLAYEDVATGYDAAEGVPGVAHLDLETLAQSVSAARERADHVIVAMHWGVEYVADPTDRQLAAARIAAEAGASLVIGNHPHWVQPIERIDQLLVAYALGNFVFDQQWSEETQQGVLLEVGYTAERMLGYRLRPIAIVDGFRPELVSRASETGRAILNRIWSATDRLPAR